MAAHIYNFKSYFYVELNLKKGGGELTKSDLDAIKNDLNEWVRPKE